MQYYNVHSHVFTMDNAPRRFLHMYLPDAVANAIDTMTNTRPGALALAWLLSKLPGTAGKRYASFLKIGKSCGQLDVFEDLLKQYNDPDIKFVALSMFMEECGAGYSTSGFAVQIEELLQVKQQYPDRLLVFLGLDPRWDAKGKKLKDMVAGYFDTKLRINASRSVYPFVGLKLYPSTGFYIFDERLKETLEWAAENEVPVLSHCNYLGGICNNDTRHLQSTLNFYDPYARKMYDQPVYQKESHFWKKIFGTNTANNNKISCSYFLEPASYKSMLHYFKYAFKKELKLCLAHYGGDQHILAAHGYPINERTLYGVEKKNWCSQIQELMQEFSNLYTDISYAVHNTKVHAPVFDDLKNNMFTNRLLFGTDFFMTEQEIPEKDDYNKFKSDALAQPCGSGTAWDQMAGHNVEQFLHSKYYPGRVV